jgi:hypothetical protein
VRLTGCDGRGARQGSGSSAALLSPVSRRAWAWGRPQRRVGCSVKEPAAASYSITRSMRDERLGMRPWPSSRAPMDKVGRTFAGLQLQQSVSKSLSGWPVSALQAHGRTRRLYPSFCPGALPH